MELDFTRLNSLAFMDFTGKKEAPKKPSETLKGEGEYKTPIEVKKPLETLTEGLEGINKLHKDSLPSNTAGCPYLNIDFLLLIILPFSYLLLQSLRQLLL